jgi:hypothetical protein
MRPTIQHATGTSKERNEAETSVFGDLTAKKRIESRLFLGGYERATHLNRDLQI